MEDSWFILVVEKRRKDEIIQEMCPESMDESKIKPGKTGKTLGYVRRESIDDVAVVEFHAEKKYVNIFVKNLLLKRASLPSSQRFLIIDSKGLIE